MNFRALAKEMAPRKIDRDTTSKIFSREELKRMFVDSGDKLPMMTTTDLAFIALKRLSAYKSAVADFSTRGQESSRRSILRMGKNFDLLMDFGVAVSELADAAR